MDSKDDRLPSSSGFHQQYVPSYHSGRRSLLPLTANDPRHALPSYPSSTLQYYYPNPHHESPQVAFYSQFPPVPHSSHPSLSHPAHGGASGVLPSVSQNFIPSLHGTPSFPSHLNLDNIADSSSHHLDNPPSASHSPHLENPSRNRSHFISPLSPPPNPQSPNLQQFQSPPLINFSQQPPPLFAAPQPIPAQPAPFPSRPLPSFPPPIPPPPVPAPPLNNVNPTLPTSFNSSLPSTKDVPLLLGRHDWGPWHSAVRTLIQNANLLGHIADNPYPGATFDPGLWPTYLVFAGSVRSGLLTLRDMDRDLDRSTVTIKGKKTRLNRPRPQFPVHGPVLTSPGLNWFKTGLDRFFC